MGKNDKKQAAAEEAKAPEAAPEAAPAASEAPASAPVADAPAEEAPKAAPAATEPPPPAAAAPEAAKPSLVKVKLLKGGQLGAVGDIVSVTKEVAEHLCRIRALHDGQKSVPYRAAISLEEAEAEARAVDEALKDPAKLAEMTQAQIESYGRKNVVETPKGWKPGVLVAAEAADKAKA